MLRSLAELPTLSSDSLANPTSARGFMDGNDVLLSAELRDGFAAAM